MKNNKKGDSPQKRGQVRRPNKLNLHPFLGTVPFFVIVCVVTFHVFAQTQSQSLLPEKPLLTEDLFSKGKTLYEKQCAVCHGVTGQGDGKAAYLLYPKPRDFTQGAYRLISGPDMEAANEDLFRTMTRGMPGSAMPSWDFLSAEERWSLVYYIRYLEERGRAAKSGEFTEDDARRGLEWPQIEAFIAKHDDTRSIEVPEALPVTPEGLNRGRELFVKACASCHGPQGKGDGQMVMQDISGYPDKPRDLTAGIFKGASSPRDLYYRIVAGLPGSPMPGYGEAFTEEQIWDLIHYVRTLPQEGVEERTRVRRLKLLSRKTTDPIDHDPLASSWLQVDPVFVPLMPLWWRNERVEGVDVRLLHDGNQIAIHLSWSDPAQDKSTVAPTSFSDGAAIQLSNDEDPPFFAMGSTAAHVDIWHWKASWQEEVKQWSDIETEYPNTATDFYESQLNYEYGQVFETAESKTQFHTALFTTGWGAGNPLSDPARQSSAEEAHAEGLGTLTTILPGAEQVQATGIWQDGKWYVVFRRQLTPTDQDRVGLKRGTSANIAFAVWDGAKGDRNGQKMVSIWNELILEE